MKENIQERIVTRYLEEEMKESYLSYAMSVIVGRALPDVRDGLKPVHRRILYTMQQLNVRYNQSFKKSARIVGEVLGKYHPHGDSAVYDSLVRMAQDFSLRYPLIQGQGNFGSIDGDPPAAMRYTEVRLSRIADYILQDIEKDTVNFTPNFDNSLQEPEILPSILPNLLINGSSGIAVGMATNIPPHNLEEVIEGLILYLDNPDCTIKDLFKVIKGPDFPTAGIICGRTEILKAYTEGRGKITLRAKANIEHNKNKEQIIITEIPYQLNKSTLIETIAELITSKKIEGVSDLRDESDKDGVRIVIELKKEAQSQIILNQLYKLTPLETTFGIIFLALVNRKPQILNLKQILFHHIQYRKEVIVRRTTFELNKAKRRAHILEGLKIAIKHLDEIIAIIKKSQEPKEAKEKLIQKFGLSDLQAQAILEMQLQRLCGLERKKIDDEYEELLKKIEYFKSILASEKKQEELIKEELLDLKEKFSDDRLTEIVSETEEIEIEDLITEEEVVVTISVEGYIKRQPLSAYRKQKRGGKGVTASGTKEEDLIEHLFVASSKDTLLFFTSMGKVFALKAYQIPLGSRIAKGRAVINVLNLDAQEKISAVLSVKESDAQKSIVMVTKNGLAKRCSLSLFDTIRKSGIIAINLEEKDILECALLAQENDEVIVATQEGQTIRFNVDELRTMGRNTIGVRGINLDKGDTVIGTILVDSIIKKDDPTILTVTEKGFAKRTHISDYRIQSRGGKGIINIKSTDKIGKSVNICLVKDEDEIVCISEKGVLIRCKAQDIRETGRSTQGVKLMNVGDADKVASVAKIMGE